MRYKLNVQALEPGDIILVGYHDEDSREIQRRIDSLYSHAMLVCYSSIIHASDIVITENPSRMLFAEDEPVCVLRLKDEFWNKMRIDDMIKYARSLVGTFYDRKALVALRDGKKVEPKENRQMCARYVAQCYDNVCLDLVDGDYELCTPEDINNSKIMRRVEKPLLEATKEDEEFAESLDVTLLQFWAIKDFLISLKRKFPNEDIVSLDQLEDFIVHNPSVGDEVLELLRRTDYFDLWAKEKEHCPYNYSVDAFKEKWKDNAARMAIDVEKDSERIIVEKQRDIMAYERKIADIGDLEYYRQMITLKCNIIEAAKERIAVAKQVKEDLGVVKIKFPWC